jgi:hypothetical protein
VRFPYISGQFRFSLALRLVAVMLGLLRMSVSQAIEELVTIASSVFRNATQQVVDQSENSHRLRQVIEGLIIAEGLPLDAKMYEPNRSISRCRVSVHLPDLIVPI